MKKKFLLTAAVCALSAVCIFGATACGKDGDDGTSNAYLDDGVASVQVTENEWKESLEKMTEITNLTVHELTVINPKNSSINTRIESEIYISDIFGFEKFKTISSSVQGNYEYVTAVFELYEAVDETAGVTYDAQFNMGMQNDKWEISKVDGKQLGYWADAYLWGAGQYKLSESQTDEFKEITEMYQFFTYQNGYYVAQLWRNSTYSGDEAVNVKVKAKFNEQGYLYYICYEYSQNESGMEVEYKDETLISNLGTTNLSYVPAEAKQAVEDYKAANN